VDPRGDPRPRRRTDLPTLGKIFGVSRTRAYQMAHTGEWEQAGIRIVPLGSKYIVAVQSILNVLGHGDSEPGTGNGTHGNGQVRSAGNAADDVITVPSGQVADGPSDEPHTSSPAISGMTARQHSHR
jgi:hypothetical protein